VCRIIEVFQGTSAKHRTRPAPTGDISKIGKIIHMSYTHFNLKTLRYFFMATPLRMSNEGR
jgi:hypothetical protein